MPQDRIQGILSKVKLNGMPQLMNHMEENGFYTSPCSTKYHGSFKGGLALHSLNVFHLLFMENHRKKLGLTYEDVAITSLLHDICKMGAYLGDESPYIYNYHHPKGHGMRSIAIIKEFIALTPLQVGMIKYHMGMYGSTEAGTYIKEYTLKELIEAFKENHAYKLLYLCDEMDTMQDGK